MSSNRARADRGRPAKPEGVTVDVLMPQAAAALSRPVWYGLSDMVALCLRS
jgi:hypothetical protein